MKHINGGAKLTATLQLGQKTNWEVSERRLGARELRLISGNEKDITRSRRQEELWRTRRRQSRDVDDELNVNTILLAARRRRCLLLLFGLAIGPGRHGRPTGGGAFPRDRREDRRHPPNLIHLGRQSLQPTIAPGRHAGEWWQ